MSSVRSAGWSVSGRWAVSKAQSMPYRTISSAAFAVNASASAGMTPRASALASSLRTRSSSGLSLPASPARQDVLPAGAKKHSAGEAGTRTAAEQQEIYACPDQRAGCGNDRAAQADKPGWVSRRTSARAPHLTAAGGNLAEASLSSWPGWLMHAIAALAGENRHRTLPASPHRTALYCRKSSGRSLAFAHIRLLY
jgi:hypothetical protein